MGARELGWLGLASLLASGCILEDQKCGENQVEISNLFEGCICAPNAVPNTDGIGCRPCDANQEVKAGACVCSAGFSRASPTAACMMVAVADAGEPTEGGTIDTDTGTAMPSGTRGLGMSCASAADCESFDATYCVLIQAPNTCQIEGCAIKAHTCPSDYDCCDFGTFAAFASTNGLCVPTGKCPAGIGKVVTP
jgi:hypothetical protein